MATLKIKQIKSMNKEEKMNKLKELKVELTKARMQSGKGKMNVKEIKKAIARILTLNKL